MTEPHQISTHIFGEMAPYYEGDKVSEDKAKLYLELWKEFTIEKLNKECYSVKLLNEQWGDRPAYLSGCLAQKAYKYVKINLQIEFKFEINPLGFQNP